VLGNLPTAPTTSGQQSPAISMRLRQCADRLRRPVLFFKKELLPSRLLSFADYPLRFDLIPNIAWAPSVGIHPLAARQSKASFDRKRYIQPSAIIGGSIGDVRNCPCCTSFRSARSLLSVFGLFCYDALTGLLGGPEGLARAVAVPEEGAAVARRVAHPWWWEATGSRSEQLDARPAVVRLVPAFGGK
jgi:hypothetical protein